MIGLGVSVTQVASRARRAAVSVGTAMPQTGAMIANFKADDLPVVADGTAIASWTDSLGNVLTQATTAKQPLYKTNIQGSRPAVRFNGSSHRISGAIAAVTALVGSTGTVIVVAKNIGATSSGYIVTTATSGGGWSLNANGTKAGVKTFTAPFAGTALTALATLGHRFTPSYFGSGAYNFTYLNGTCLGWNVGASFSAATDFSLGGTANDIAYAACDILAVYVWSTFLTHTEMMQAEKAIRESYGVEKTWETLGKQYIFHGDSITASFTGTASFGETYPYQVAAAMGLKFGQWHNLGRFGSTPGSLTTMQADFTGSQALLGVPIYLTYGEYKNQDTATTANQVAANTAYLNALSAAGITHRLFWTATDYANRLQPNKSNYCAYWDVAGNRAGLMEGYAPIHTDPNIGIDGASPNASPFTPNFNDSTGHMLAPGTAFMASFMTPYVQALP